MRKHKTILPLLAGLLVCAVSLHAADKAKDNTNDKPAKKDDAKPKDSRELLSLHRTIATLKGIEFHKCLGRTSLCPDRCGHSGDFASFTILHYLEYQKPGQYGDPKAEAFSFQIEDNRKNLKIPAELAKTVRDLKPGDSVQLEWRHDYVTRIDPGGGVSKSPERVVTLIEKISKEEAEKRMKKA